MLRESRVEKKRFSNIAVHLKTMDVLGVGAEMKVVSLVERSGSEDPQRSALSPRSSGLIIDVCSVIPQPRRNLSVSALTSQNTDAENV